MNTPDILLKILRHKAKEVSLSAEQVSLREMSARAERQPPTKGFEAALRTKIADHQPAVIAEIKRASPSKGIIREHFDPQAIAIDYENHGAAALSVLTDEAFFHGAASYLETARAATTIPILRKEFIVDQYQIYEARAIGADAILLIVSALGDAQLAEFSGLARHLDLDVLVEVHDAEELERALTLGISMVGINNRNLRTFETTLDTTVDLLAAMPDQCVVITESGIHTRADVARMNAAGVYGFLVGEAFMRADSPGEKLRELFF
ncbi:MAG: indole-3-glycerol phosphate synthase TrpC [Pseudomonadota bacterium]